MRQYAGLHGCVVIPEHEFKEDYTATRLDRPELNKVRRLVQHREIDALIIYASDRLTRDRAHGPILRDELVEAGVELHFVTRGKVENTPEGELFSGIEDQFNAYWRAKMLEAAMRGRRGKVEAGIIPGQGSLPFGYTKEGKQRDILLVIAEEQAAIVRDIYRWFVSDNLTASDIAKRLTALAIPTPSGANMGSARQGTATGTPTW